MSNKKVTHDESQRKSVASAVRAGLDARGIKRKEAAALLGLTPDSFRNQLCKGSFTDRMAQKWSAVLGLPYDIFFPQETDLSVQDSIDKLKAEVKRLRSELDAVKVVLAKISAAAAPMAEGE